MANLAAQCQAVEAMAASNPPQSQKQLKQKLVLLAARLKGDFDSKFDIAVQFAENEEALKEKMTIE